ncbi:MAG: S1C family serine protease [Polyangiaceae bacterium]|jgi:S1-C subfamily serine protease|nr:S1C family serine protease [Polyangiaceae bacterium]
MTNELLALSNSLADLVARLEPSLVRIEGRTRRGTTGVVYDEEGTIVTAAHALGRADSVALTLPDGSTQTAPVVGRDAGTDVALVRASLPKAVPPIWSDATPRVGQMVLALARPGRTVRASLGIVGASGEGFRTAWGGQIDRYLQVDLEPPPGFSGGLLLGVDGGALGMTSAGLARGVGLTIPVSTLRRVVDELRAHGRVRRGYLGVSVYPVRLPPALAEAGGQSEGALLVAVEPSSPAGDAGLMLGDVLLTLNGTPIKGPDDLLTLLREQAASEVTLRFLRGGVGHEARFVTGERAPQPLARLGGRRAGAFAAGAAAAEGAAPGGKHAVAPGRLDARTRDDARGRFVRRPGAFVVGASDHGLILGGFGDKAPWADGVWQPR